MSEGAIRNADGDRICYAVIRQSEGGEWVDLGTLAFDARTATERDRRLVEHLSSTPSGHAWLDANPKVRLETFALVATVNARGEKGTAFDPSVKKKGERTYRRPGASEILTEK